MEDLLFSIPKEHFEWQCFRSGRGSGQYHNKVGPGVRVIHKLSGAVGESCASKHRYKNMELALEKLMNTEEFKNWQRMEWKR